MFLPVSINLQVHIDSGSEYLIVFLLGKMASVQDQGVRWEGVAGRGPGTAISHRHKGVATNAAVRQKELPFWTASHQYHGGVDRGSLPGRRCNYWNWSPGRRSSGYDDTSAQPKDRCHGVLILEAINTFIMSITLTLLYHLEAGRPGGYTLIVRNLGNLEGERRRTKRYTCNCESLSSCGWTLLYRGVSGRRGRAGGCSFCAASPGSHAGTPIDDQHVSHTSPRCRPTRWGSWSNLMLPYSHAWGISNQGQGGPSGTCLLQVDPRDIKVCEYRLPKILI